MDDEVERGAQATAGAVAVQATAGAVAVLATRAMRNGMKI
jgi:hypothetical protein